jgi:lipoyl-dependent peroxiredoxin
MPMAERKARVVWNGSLSEGSGKLNFESSSAATDLPVTWAARTEVPGGKTSPEELIASAHASCYAMAFSNVLSQEGHEPEQLTIDAVCTLDMVDGGPKVTKLDLNIEGKVAGLDQPKFQELATQAEQGCPISNLFRNNAEISVNAKLVS